MESSVSKSFLNPFSQIFQEVESFADKILKFTFSRRQVLFVQALVPFFQVLFLMFSCYFSHTNWAKKLCLFSKTLVITLTFSNVFLFQQCVLLYPKDLLLGPSFDNSFYIYYSTLSIWKVCPYLLTFASLQMHVMRLVLLMHHSQNDYQSISFCHQMELNFYPR